MKEIYIYLITLFVLSLLMHFKEFFSIPFEHISNLTHSGAYGLGASHPLVFTLIAYLLLWLPRAIYKLIKK